MTNNSRNHRVRFMTNNFITTSNITATSENSSFPLSNLVNSLRHKVYKPTAMTDQGLIVDLGAPYPIGFAALISPLGTPFPVSQGGSVKIQADNINVASNWSGSPSLDLTMSWSDLGAFRFIDDQSATPDDYSYRYWRFFFDDDYADIGGFSHAYLGSYTTVANRNIQRGFQKKTIDPSIIQESDSGGAFYVNNKLKYNTISNAGVIYIDASDRRELEQMVFDVGISSPFYVSLDPTLQIGTSLDELTMYARFVDTPIFAHVKADIYSMVGITMKEVG